MQNSISYQNRVILENEKEFFITLETQIEDNKYWYLMNLKNNADILIVRVKDEEIEIIDQPEELSKIILKMVDEIKMFFD